MNKEIIYASYNLGNSITENLINITKPFSFYAYLSKPNLTVINNTTGYITDYEYNIIIDNIDLPYAREDTVFWIKNQPNLDYNNYDYKVKRLGELNKNSRQRIIYLEKVQSQNFQNLWYAINSDIYEVQLLYDRLTKISILPINMYFPIKNDTLIWDRKPIDINSKNGLIKFKSEELNEKSRILTFIGVE